MMRTRSRAAAQGARRVFVGQLRDVAEHRLDPELTRLARNFSRRLRRRRSDPSRCVRRRQFRGRRGRDVLGNERFEMGDEQRQCRIVPRHRRRQRRSIADSRRLRNSSAISESRPMVPNGRVHIQLLDGATQHRRRVHCAPSSRASRVVRRRSPTRDACANRTPPPQSQSTLVPRPGRGTTTAHGRAARRRTSPSRSAAPRRRARWPSRSARGSERPRSGENRRDAVASEVCAVARCSVAPR